MPEIPAPAVLRDLEAATDRHPLDRKLLVCASMGEGRELLRSLAVRGRAWVGWEITTLRRLAMESVAAGLAAEGLAVADAFEEQAVVDVALDAALTVPGSGPLRELGEAPGFRQAVLNAVQALRLAGVDGRRLRGSRSSNTRVRDLLAAVLDRYEAGLAEGGRVDTAAVMARAEAAIRGGSVTGRSGSGEEPGPVPVHVYLVPGLRLGGSAGRLVRALRDAGATPLRADPVEGADPVGVLWEPADEPGPLGALLAGRREDGVELDLFAASGPSEEIREVLRRAMAAGLRWDQVEIVATDPVVYGGALHALAERLGIPVSYAVGLPVERTRTGRAAAAYFTWIEGGYPADVIRRLLEAGDLRPSGDAPPGRSLARRLRSLRIGWGPDRYLRAIDRALERLEGPPRPRRGETLPEAEEREGRERRELESLRSLLQPVMAATPRLDAADPDAKVSPAELASGLHAFLDRVAPGDAPSATARERLLDITARIAATLTRRTEPAAAVALLRAHLEIRVPAPQREGSAPWISDGGHVHLSDIDHGGLADRPATFVVGLDADRFPGAGLQDPLLLDTQRRALDPEALPTSGQRLAATRFRLAACLARLRGAVTLSYSAWDPTEARHVAPSSVMLQAHRARTGHPDASFEDLAQALGDAASAIPADAAIDATDAWFRALERDGILRGGVTAVREAHPGLDAGMAALAALKADEATSHHGATAPRPDRLDPRRNADLVLSASGLEDLGACARRYFYRYALGVRKPDDPELDPDVWLDAMERGRLLHAVYEGTLRAAREAGVGAGDPAFIALALETLEREARAMAREVPSPGEAVRSREMAALRDDVRSFAEMVTGRDGAWEALELRFGFEDEPPAALELGGGSVRLRGAIDRVDRVGDVLTVVDYKTGTHGRFERRHGTFHGGRRLQNAVYAAVAESLLGRAVARMEYHFPTRRGQNEVVGFRRDELRRGLGLIDRLLDAVALGRFLPTEDGDDCRFCDYAPICRHSVDGWTGETPLADWAAERLETLPEYRELREVRSWDDTFLAELGGDR
ncbi:MAG: hypothetical protein GWM90_26575 [Gemmatimonadetes bacterium]|nr:hypothetical protein [Gemmatimonadota bacterium]NIQ58468.1 hypothetical protein [Gemmatimonadota bacterium]NIU73710.1 hypothetical protein [Gammaproteobacteria bacterium]NIX47504.1 hypothetical protein [Gemmatimonadota bacterium]NIY08074.1 hypothetical protein [Gemmatimonadota bacterium]